MTPARPAPPRGSGAGDGRARGGVASPGRILVPVFHLAILLLPRGVLPGWHVHRPAVARLPVPRRPVLPPRIPLRARVPLPPRGARVRPWGARVRLRDAPLRSGGVHVRAGVLGGRPGRGLRLAFVCAHRRLPPQRWTAVTGGLPPNARCLGDPPARRTVSQHRARVTLAGSQFWTYGIIHGFTSEIRGLDQNRTDAGGQRPPGGPLRSQVTLAFGRRFNGKPGRAPYARINR